MCPDVPQHSQMYPVTGFFVSNQVRFIERDDLSEVTADFETQWIEIESDLHHNMICGVIYRHPNGNLDSFMASINNCLDKVNNENKYCLVMGDFNINLLNTDSHAATEEFLDMITSYYFSPHILQPTRITHHSATLIDNILFNSTEHHTVSGNIVFDLTDHLPNFIIINKFNTLPKHIKFTRRDYSKYNEEALLQDCRSIDWNCTTTDSKNITMMFDSLHNKSKNVINKHIPLKQLSQKDIKQISKPWITRGIQKSIKVKNKYYKKFISNRSPYYQSKFKTYRNKLNHLIKLSKISYYNKYFDSNKFNIKNIWKGIKQLISLKNPYLVHYQHK